MGTVVAAVNYVDGDRLRREEPAVARPLGDTEERATFERKLGIMRRTVLGLDLLLFGGLGYWIGDAIGG